MKEKEIRRTFTATQIYVANVTFVDGKIKSEPLDTLETLSKIDSIDKANKFVKKQYGEQYANPIAISISTEKRVYAIKELDFIKNARLLPIE